MKRDEKITKAIGCCADIDCHNCPFTINDDDCNNLERLSFDLINRQAKTIKKLQSIIWNSQNTNLEKGRNANG